MPAELDCEQADLQQLRVRGDAAAQHEADQVQKLYHDRRMDGLAKDVYHVAAGDKGEPPAGWTRLSEHTCLDTYGTGGAVCQTAEYNAGAVESQLASR